MSGSHCKLQNTSSLLPETYIDISAFFIFCKCRARIRLVSVNLPESGKLEVARVMVDKALHVLGRIAQKQPDLMRKLRLVLQPADERPHAAPGVLVGIARVSERPARQLVVKVR